MFPTQRSVALFVLFVAGASAGVVPAADAPAKVRDALSARLFPMAIGAKWIYASDDGDVKFEVLRTEKDRAADTDCFVVRRTIGKSEVDFGVAVEEDGVYILREGEKVFDPPLRQFAFFARTGDTWKWKGTFGTEKRDELFEHLGAEEVTVAAGKFATLAVQRTNPANGDHATFWLARDVGVVRLSGKTELLAAPTASKVVFEWRLKSYTPGKK
jgi:hypothetical protein